jgi:hypothetical protein
VELDEAAVVNMSPLVSVVLHDDGELHEMSVDDPVLPVTVELQLVAPPAGSVETNTDPKESMAAQNVTVGHEIAFMY